jgi:hypothetical protein
MANTSWITDILTNDPNRAFKNLFNFHISIDNDGNTNSVRLNDSFNHIPYTAERVVFGGDLSLETYYSEAVKDWFIVAASKIKQVTVTFRETGNYDTYKVLKAWMGNIYDDVNNYFKPYDPRATMSIVSDNMATQDKDIPGHAFVIRGAFPTTITPPEYDWSTGEPQLITATFNFRTLEFV